MNNRIEMKTAAIITLGCKLNQYESMGIRESLEDWGLQIIEAEKGADLYIVNTCTVTGKTDSRSRHAVRRITSWNLHARIVVTGCSVQRDHSEFSDLPNVILVAGNREKSKLLELLQEVISSGMVQSHVKPMDSAPFEQIKIKRFSGYTRAFLKVQEGCPRNCTYCIIPKVRGKSRSQTLDSALTQAEQIVRSGFREIVLTGIDLGSYGFDLTPPSDVMQLTQKLLSISGLHRIRMSSIEPSVTLEDLIRFMAVEPRICRHLHIPLQSGCDAILKLMNRSYSCSEYLTWLKFLRDKMPETNIGADVITAFPGETEALFQETFDFIKDSPINYLHVFTFSPRSGTPAASFDGQINPETAKKRCHALRNLSRSKALEFRKNQMDNTHEVVILGTFDPETGLPVGLSGNYIKFLIETTTPEAGSFVHIKPTRCKDLSCFGKVVD